MKYIKAFFALFIGTVVIPSIASAAPAFLVLLFIPKYFDYLTIFLALVILSVVVFGLDSLNTRRVFGEE